MAVRSLVRAPQSDSSPTSLHVRFPASPPANSSLPQNPAGCISESDRRYTGTAKGEEAIGTSAAEWPPPHTASMSRIAGSYRCAVLRALRRGKKVEAGCTRALRAACWPGAASRQQQGGRRSQGQQGRHRLVGRAAADQGDGVQGLGGCSEVRGLGGVSWGVVSSLAGVLGSCGDAEAA